jgi:superfamily II DNA helicase RecQ
MHIVSGNTVAFGMGVNITDIDIVVHWGLPTSPLSY